MRKFTFVLLLAFVSVTMNARPLLITVPSSGATEAVVPVAPGNTEKPEARSYSYKEMKTMVEEKLNRKLSLKEKIVLKLTKNKLNKAFKSLPAPEGTTDKSQLVAALLCFFLGGFGIHDFYIGRTWAGIVKLLLLITGIFLFIPLIVLSVWVLVDLVLILTGSLKPKGGDYGKKL